MEDVTMLPLAELQVGCAERSKNERLDAYCMEIFRRALSPLHHDQLECQTAAVSLYEGFVFGWLRKFDPTGQFNHADKAQDVHAKFWASYSLQQFEKAQGIGSIFAYIRTTTLNVILQAQRAEDSKKALHQSIEELEETVGQEADVAKPLDIRQFWDGMEGYCRTWCELLAMRFKFLLAMKPQEMVEEHPVCFPSASEASTILRRVLTRIRRDKRGGA